jgi:hypothetical protein
MVSEASPPGGKRNSLAAPRATFSDGGPGMDVDQFDPQGRRRSVRRAA